jgi:hypothetical protein
VGITEMYDFCPVAILHRLGVRTKLAAYTLPFAQPFAQRYGIPGFASYMRSIVILFFIFIFF